MYRDATAADLPRGVEIYNAAVATREASSDVHGITVEPRRPVFEEHGVEGCGFMPRVARLEGAERDLALVGRRLHS